MYIATKRLAKKNESKNEHFLALIIFESAAVNRCSYYDDDGDDDDDD